MEKYIFCILCANTYYSQTMDFLHPKYNNHDDNLISALSKAVANADCEQVRLLIEMGVDINGYSKLGFCPLHVAASKGVVSEFISVYPEPTPFPGDHASIVRILLAAGVDLEAPSAAWKHTALYYAARYGNSEILRILLQAGARHDIKHQKDESTTLHHAALTWDLAKIKLLVGARADIDAQDNKGKTAADWAQSKVMRHYLVHKARATQTMFQALEWNNLITARQQLMLRADGNTQNLAGDTLLHCSVRKGLPIIARMLFCLGADPSISNKEGETALSINPHFWYNYVFSTTG